jgi:hypothetical protein
MKQSCRYFLLATTIFLVTYPLMPADGFIPGKIFISSSNTQEVRIYDAEKHVFESAFTNKLFTVPGKPTYPFGPNGLGFNSRGNLVVAAYDHFVEFKSPGVEFRRYPKVMAEATENIAFDSLGNLYTTTSTGGSNLLQQYRASDYGFQQTITLPTGAGQLTGITFDGNRQLFVASQSDGKIHILQANEDFLNFQVIKPPITSANRTALEGIQINRNGELVTAGGNIVRYNPETGAVLGTCEVPGLWFPVPLTINNSGMIYTADFEDGAGTLSADIFQFSPSCSIIDSFHDDGLFGPFGLAISGTTLPHDIHFQRGDANADGFLEISDPIIIFVHLFLGNPMPPCPDALDADDSGTIDINDGMFILNWLFQNGPPMPAPGSSCGPDPTDEDQLPQCSYNRC